MWEWAAIGTLSTIVIGLIIPAFRAAVNMQRAIDAGNADSVLVKAELQNVKNELHGVKKDVAQSQQEMRAIGTTVAEIKGLLQGKFGV